MSHTNILSALNTCSHSDSQDTFHLHAVHSSLNDNQDKINQIASFCVSNNIRLTELRKEVLSIILNSNKAISAYEILPLLKNREKPAAPPTVYRTLDFLLENGFIHRLSSINAYIPCCHPRDVHTSAFLICNDCNSVFELSKKPLFNELEAVLQLHEFTAHQSVVEVFGLCGSCKH